jgi:hypothetical protein
MRILSLVAVLSAAWMFGCSSGQTGRASAPPDRRNLVTQEELQGITSANALDAVQALRSHWLRPRASSLRSGGSMTLPEVFVDHQHFGPLESLRQLRTESIQEIQFISPPDATTRYGTGYTGGIIHVLTRRL